MPVAAQPEFRMRWVGRQSEALLDTTRYLDIEGAIRSSKTTIGIWKVLNACADNPGMRWLVSRWIEDDVNALIKPLLGEAFAKLGWQPRWYPDEHRYELANGSWIYIRGLRPSESASRFSKFRGMTLGGVYVDQAEEIPEDFFLELKGRLSQVGMPHQMVLTPNPPGDDHWLAKHFPDTYAGAPANPDHKLIRLTLYDNAHNLGDDYIRQTEQAYPEGHPMRRRLIFGQRGLSVVGKPVYAGYFKRHQHVSPLLLNPAVPLVECIDFGHHHPCVLWAQFQPWGALWWLGGVMGEDMYIEDFAPLIAQYRAEWFPDVQQVWACCDPAGSHQNSQGTRLNGVKILQQNDIYPRWVDSSNMPETRSGAIQVIAGYMRRRTIQGDEAFQVDPSHWRVVSSREARHKPFAIDALEAGYVWDERVRTSAAGKKLIVPLKDGYYEHVMNCAEYGVINYGPAKLSPKEERKLEERAMKLVTKRDRDPDDPRVRQAGFQRGGYR